MKPSFSRDTSEREAEALANMMGVDSRRIDGLVGDVGEIKGDVRSLKGDTSRTATGVEQLQQSMAVLSRHAVLMETQSAEITLIRTRHDALEGRVRDIETDMPGILETRSDVRQTQWLVWGAVIAAVLGFVVMSRS